MIYAVLELEDIDDVLLRVLQKNRANSTCVFVCVKRFSVRNLLLQLWKLTSPKMCSWQARDPREPMV